MMRERVKFGVEGLDAMLSGGLPRESICAIIGTYGTGKTTFALQFAYEGLSRGENVIYISLEEREELLRATMAQKGWETEAFGEVTGGNIVEKILVQAYRDYPDRPVESQLARQGANSALQSALIERINKQEAEHER